MIHHINNLLGVNGKPDPSCFHKQISIIAISGRIVSRRLNLKF